MLGSPAMDMVGSSFSRHLAKCRCFLYHALGEGFDFELFFAGVEGTKPICPQARVEPE